jgi:tetratricopeptide (TPR) repeat protein
MSAAHGKATGVSGYTAREVAKLADLTVPKVKSLVEARFLAPSKGPDGELRFNFQDLILLRTAKGLLDANIPARKIRHSLANLRQQLPDGAPLTGVRISAEENRVVVRDGRSRWTAESGQVLFDFELTALDQKVTVLTSTAAEDAQASYERGCTLEDDGDNKGAIAAYREAVRRDSKHADAHINLGRLLQEAREAAAAEKHYRTAIQLRPHDSTAWFNLGTALEDLRRSHDAEEAYRKATEAQNPVPDAWYNLARLCEKHGQVAEALRHLKTYRKIIRGGR